MFKLSDDVKFVSVCANLFKKLFFMEITKSCFQNQNISLLSIVLSLVLIRAGFWWHDYQNILNNKLLGIFTLTPMSSSVKKKLIHEAIDSFINVWFCKIIIIKSEQSKSYWTHFLYRIGPGGFMNSITQAGNTHCKELSWKCHEVWNVSDYIANRCYWLLRCLWKAPWKSFPLSLGYLSYSLRLSSYLCLWF